MVLNFQWIDSSYNTCIILKCLNCGFCAANRPEQLVDCNSVQSNTVPGRGAKLSLLILGLREDI